MSSTRSGGGSADPIYVVGRSDAETQRLIRQAAFREPLTRRLFTEAGITEGMKVLDLGSGAGDVAFLAADLVGATGSVLGVDADPEVVRTARARAEAAGLTNVEFIEDDLRAVDPGESFDAIVGRFVLMYLPDPGGALRTATKHLRPGGTIAIQECNWARDSLLAHPPTPLWEQTWSLMCETVRRAGVEMQMGYKLHRSFVEAELPQPEMLLQSKVVSGSDTDAHEYAADTLGSMMPLLVRFGIAIEEEVEIETVAQRLREETLASGSVVKISDVVSAHARTAS